ncbi:hypothetical protein E0F15_21965 [Frankia sp. B2]|uniref:hypothetical protein n=1 Tax=Frankia sp. B2 TaxID=2541730 RepID=UPI00106B8E7D|nr:hypothetical protein [Frankia sp. B2]TFE24324.1 hypothetical protein E0F15_21965 [Frankia sp. B2]
MARPGAVDRRHGRLLVAALVLWTAGLFFLSLATSLAIALMDRSASTPTPVLVTAADPCTTTMQASYSGSAHYV